MNLVFTLCAVINGFILHSVFTRNVWSSDISERVCVIGFGLYEFVAADCRLTVS